MTCASALTPVEEEQPEVGERVAERRHLPVEHRDDLARVVGRHHRVVEAVVAVHDRGRAGRRAARRAAGARARRPRAARGSSTAPTARPSAAPAARGSRRGGRTRRARPPRSRRAWIAASTSTSTSETRRASSGVEAGERGAVAVDDAVDQLHHVEGRVVDREVLAQRERAGHRARRCRASAVITRYSRTMSCAVGSTCPSGGRRSTQVLRRRRRRST